MIQPSYRVGQYWNYNITDYNENTTYGNSTFKVLSLENIIINNTNYEVFNCSETIEMEELNFPKKRSFYIISSNNSLLKLSEEEFEIKYPYGGFFGISWPIYEGKTWTTNDTAFIYYDNTYETRELSINYACLNKTNLTINNEIFECFEIKRWNWGDDENQNYTFFYYSPKAGGRYIKREEYKNGEITQIYELTDYNLIEDEDSKKSSDYEHDFKKSNGDLFTNFFLIIIIMVISLVVVLFLIKKIG